MWQPANLSESCPVVTNLTACSSFGCVYLNLLVQIFGRSREEWRGTHERDRQEKLIEEYDFIVVGAGSSGCVVASRLSEIKRWKVLLLEAGPEQPDVTLVPSLTRPLIGSNIDWKYSTQPNGGSCLASNGQCSWPRGKMMGGCSSINTMVYVRGNKLDYDSWAAMGNDGWSYDDILPYYRKLEDNLNIKTLNPKYYGVNGPQTISRYPFTDLPSFFLSEAFIQMGFPYRDTNAEEQCGSNQNQVFSKNGERVSANNAYIEKIRHTRNNLKVKTEAEAVKILIDPLQQKAYGVKYIKGGKVFTAIAKKEVIVSCGAVNSPKLLMLSGIGPKEHLNEVGIPLVKDLKVGENLHDHVSFQGLTISLPNKIAPVVCEEQMLQMIKEYAAAHAKTGPLSSSVYYDVAFYKTNPSLAAPDIEIQFDSGFWKEYINQPLKYGKVSIFPTVFYDSIMPVVINIDPRSRGKVLLNSSNPYGPPLMYPNYLGDPRDLEILKLGAKKILKIEDTPVFKNLGAKYIRTPLPACKHTSWGTDEFFECTIRNYTYAPTHIVGTCKMGPREDPTTVVDSRLRVHGIKRLRVIDCSVMPKVTSGNPNGPALMIGEVGADKIKEDWGIKINPSDY